MHRFGHLVDGEWVAHVHPQVFRMPQKEDSSQRITAGVSDGPTVLWHLLECMAPPYYLLYILHTPRGVSRAGRYESPALTADQIQEFLVAFSAFLVSDGRFDLWVHSPNDKATLVWDRHNELFAYGRLDDFSTKLQSIGFTAGVSEIPVPHEHCYHAELDHLAKDLLATFDWSHSPLRPEDEQ